MKEALGQAPRGNEERQQRRKVARVLSPLCLGTTAITPSEVSVKRCPLLVRDAGSEVAVDKLDVRATRGRQVTHRCVGRTERVPCSADEGVNGSRARLERLGHVLGRLPVDLTHDQRGPIPGADGAQSQEHVARVGAGEDLVSGVRRLQPIPCKRLLLDARVLRRASALPDDVDHDVACDGEQPRARMFDAAGFGTQQLHEDFLRGVCGGPGIEGAREAVAVDALLVAPVDLGERHGIAAQCPVEDGLIRKLASTPRAECE